MSNEITGWVLEYIHGNLCIGRTKKGWLHYVTFSDEERLVFPSKAEAELFAVNEDLCEVRATEHVWYGGIK